MADERFSLQDGVLGLCAAALLAWASGGGATTVNKADADCSGLELKAASGVPDGPVHQYAFKGICNSFVNHISDGSSTGKTPDKTYWAEAKAEWNEQASTLTERVTLSNPPASGSWDVVTILKCTKDPIVYKPSCVLVQHKNETKWQGFSNAALEQKRPILSGKTTLTAAAALSKQAKGGTPPSPAAQAGAKAGASSGASSGAAVASSAGASSVAGGAAIASQAGATAGGAKPTLLNVEAEDLVKAGKSSVNAGKVAIQPMAGFGSGWSGNAQLFWSGGSVGAVLDLAVTIPAAATYAVELYLTRAPDYADLKMEIDGKAVSFTFQGFAPGVMAPSPLQAGKFSLPAGTRKVSFMIAGKYPKSTGYYMGLDRIRLYPVGAP